MKDYTSNPQEGQPLRNEKGYVIGRIINDKLVKHVSASRHLLRFPRGWSFDIAGLEQAKQAGVTVVVVIDDDSSRTYTAPLSSFWTDGQFVDRGYGAQLCLTLECWTITS